MMPLKILFKYPCRGRETSFFESLDSIYNNLSDKENFHISLTLDTDDEVLNRPEVIERLAAYKNTSIEWGLSTSKIHAINRSMPDYDFDVIVCWSNDMIINLLGFDDIMRGYISELIEKHGDDFLAHFPERDSMSNLNVLYVATRKYYDRFGYIYHPSYLSLWADNETYDVSKILGKYYYIDVLGLYEHRNPAYSQYGIERDELFNKQQALWGVDEANYIERRSRNFDL